MNTSLSKLNFKPALPSTIWNKQINHTSLAYLVYFNFFFLFLFCSFIYLRFRVRVFLDTSSPFAAGLPGRTSRGRCPHTRHSGSLYKSEESQSNHCKIKNTFKLFTHNQQNNKMYFLDSDKLYVNMYEHVYTKKYISIYNYTYIPYITPRDHIQ